jgi:hypothetical protein
MSEVYKDGKLVSAGVCKECGRDTGTSPYECDGEIFCSPSCVVNYQNDK